MLDMRFTLPTVMRAKKGITTAYGLSKATGSAIPISTAARLIDTEHPPTRIDFRVLEVLCKALDATPNELLIPDEADKWPPAPPAAPAVRKRGGKSKRAAA